MIYEGDNALDAVMMNVNGEYVSWVLRKDADEIVQGEANHISETGWWYATPPVSGSNIQYGGAAYGGVDYTFDQGPIAVRFPMPFPMTTLCFIGTNVKFSLYPWNTDYATTTAQTRRCWRNRSRAESGSIRAVTRAEVRRVAGILPEIIWP